MVALSEHLTLPHGIGLSNCFPDYFPETFRVPVMPIVAEFSVARIIRIMRASSVVSVVTYAMIIQSMKVTLGETIVSIVRCRVIESTVLSGLVVFTLRYAMTVSVFAA